MAKAIPSTDNILGSFPQVFPRTDFSHNLFHDWDHCLRFELGGDDVPDFLCLRRFIQAFERADAVASWLFRDTEELWLLSSDYGDEKPRKKRLKPYKKTTLRPSDFQYLGKVFQEDSDDFTGDIYRHWDATILKERWQLREVLWLTLGAEMGVRPTVSADIYVVDFARGLVLHPYDDSGMDVSATRKETLVHSTKSITTGCRHFGSMKCALPLRAEGGALPPVGHAPAGPVLRLGPAPRAPKGRARRESLRTQVGAKPRWPAPSLCTA